MVYLIIRHLAILLWFRRSNCYWSSHWSLWYKNIGYPTLRHEESWG